MLTTENHLLTVIRAEDAAVACSDTHQPEAATLRGRYQEAESFLGSAIAKDISPERLVLSGDILSDWLDGTYPVAYIDSDDGDDGPAPPKAVLELWAADKTELVLVSKSRELPVDLLARQVKNSFAFIPGMVARRTEKISRSVLEVSGLDVIRYTRPKVINDSTFVDLRRQKNTFTDAPTYIARLSTAFRAMSAELGMPEPDDLPRVKEQAAVMAPLLNEEQFRSLPEAVRTQKIQSWVSFFVHKGMFSLLKDTKELERAAQIVQNGQILSPSTPQHPVRYVPRYKRAWA